MAVVSVPNECDAPPSGLVGWWPGNGNANDIIHSNNGVLVGGVTYAAGEVGQAFNFNGSDYVAISNSPIINALTTNMTVEGWIKVTQFSSQDWISMICKGDTAWQIRRYSTGSTLSFYTAGLSVQELVGSRNINDGKWHHVAGVYNGTNKYLYVDGTLDVSTAATGSIGTNTNGFWLGDNPTASQRSFDGLVNAVSIYNRALSATEIAAIYNAGSSGKCPPMAPSIASQPTGQIVGVGGAVGFTVGAAGTAPLSYQWTFNGTNVFGATNSALELTNVQLVQAGHYAVMITNYYGSILSSNAALTVLQTPIITLQPYSQTNLAGSTASFISGVAGSSPFYLQWQANGVSLTNGGNISGAQSTNLILSAVEDTNAASYTLFVSNLVGCVTSLPALLTVVDPPTVFNQPANQTVTLTSNATFFVTVAGTGPLMFQWNLNGASLAGATNSILSLTNIQFSQAGNYSVSVTNAYGSVISSNAALVVYPLYQFVWNPIPSPRFVGTPFGVVIQAQNATNGLATNFTGVLTLGSTNGIALIPAISGNFVQGVWTGTVAVAQTATNLVLDAIDNLGESGLANPINVVNLPSLNTLSSEGSLLMLWPVEPSGFQLETTPQLIPATWVPVTTAPFQLGGENLISIPLTGTNAFYRLHFSGQ